MSLFSDWMKKTSKKMADSRLEKLVLVSQCSYVLGRLSLAKFDSTSGCNNALAVTDTSC